MTIQKSILSIFLILAVTEVCGQTIEPIDLAKKIFGRDKFTDIDNFITGEYKGQPNGEDLSSGASTSFFLLRQTNTKAVVSMTILDSLGKGVDTYLHFEKKTSWKMSAFRGLALTGMIEMLKNELEKMTSEQVDSIIDVSKKASNVEFSMFKSRDEYDFLLGNTKLTLELDENIVNHFLANQTEFELLKDSALKELGSKKVDDGGEILLIENLQHNYKKVFISSVSYGSYQLGNCISFLIGGMVDNSVGYLFVKDKNNLPEMSPSGIIMIREIGNGWYVYKTT
jgi:hypothetical protein